MSFYRPSYGVLPYDDRPPPPPPDMPPLPPGPPPPFDPSRDGDSWPPRSPPRRDFSFRNRDSAPEYPGRHDSYRPRPQQYADNGPRRRNHHDNQNLNRPQRGRYARGGRPRLVTSDRPLLKTHHDENETNLQMLGVTEGAAKYLNTGEIDDSEEEAMDESNSERESGEVNKFGVDGTVDEDTSEPPPKKRDTGQKEEASASQAKWSNPDPYSVLPPIDETLSKRKDPVETIRKYRKAQEDNVAVVNPVAANDDFISFDMDDGSLVENEPSESEEDSEEEGGVKIPGAPAGPRYPQRSQNGVNDSSSFQEPESNRHVRSSETYPPTSINIRGGGPPRQTSSQTTTARPPSPPPPDQIVLDTNEDTYPGFSDADDSYNDSLGSRKRTHDDRIKGSGGRGAARSALSLLDEWRPGRNVDPLPWLRRSEYITARPGLRLHKELCDFFDFVRPQKYEEIVREELINRLRAAVQKEYPRSDVHCFGSFAAGLYLPNADMDVVVTSDDFRKHGDKIFCQSNSKLRKFGDFVKLSGLAKPHTVDCIVGAKVPIIKFVDRVTSIRVDVSFENDSGLVAIDTFHAWKRQFPAMPVLVTVIKQFLMMRGLNEVQHGGLGGFSVTCLVTSLLQHMPRVQTGELVPEDHLGEMLIEFLDFYGSRLDISRTGITMDPPGYFDKVSVFLSSLLCVLI